VRRCQAPFGWPAKWQVIFPCHSAGINRSPDFWSCS
jgi:hypothetical protein